MFEMLDEIAEIPLAAIRAELLAIDVLDPILDAYLVDVVKLIIGRKSRVTRLDEDVNLTVRFDFLALHEKPLRSGSPTKDSTTSPMGSACPCHTATRSATSLAGYFSQQYGHKPGRSCVFHPPEPREDATGTSTP